jgi:hypothetical protein
MKKVRTQGRERKLKSTDVEVGAVNIKAIRNRELRKNQGKVLEKQKEMEKKYKNAHSQFYGESDDSEDERVIIYMGILFRCSIRLEDSRI